MWSFYDELYMGIPSGLRVEGCVVGKLWTTVRAGGNLGMARTLGDTDVDRNALAQSMVGRYLRDVANVLQWDSLLRASVGVAAMNAFYNRPDALEKRGPSEFGADLGGAVAVIGELPTLEASLREFCDVTALPLPEGGEPDAACDAAMKRDFVFISGDALTNRTLPALLERVGEGTRVSLTGVSVPAAPVMFAFGNPIHDLSGVYAAIPTTVESAARLDLPDLAPGTKPFSIGPVRPEYLHQRPETVRYQASPYRASKFNSAFNPWKGRDCDPETWSPIFKG